MSKLYDAIVWDVDKVVNYRKRQDQHDLRILMGYCKERFLQLQVLRKGDIDFLRESNLELTVGDYLEKARGSRDLGILELPRKYTRKKGGI